MRETQNSSSLVIQQKLRVQIELSDSIIESSDVLSHKNKQKSYICSSIWSVPNCLLWWRALMFAWGGWSLLVLRAGNFLVHFFELVCKVSTLPKVTSNKNGQLDRNVSAVNWNITQRKVSFINTEAGFAKPVKGSCNSRCSCQKNLKKKTILNGNSCNPGRDNGTPWNSMKVFSSGGPAQ